MENMTSTCTAFYGCGSTSDEYLRLDILKILSPMFVSTNLGAERTLTDVLICADALYRYVKTSASPCEGPEVDRPCEQQPENGIDSNVKLSDSFRAFLDGLKMGMDAAESKVETIDHHFRDFMESEEFKQLEDKFSTLCSSINPVAKNALDLLKKLKDELNKK